MVARQLLAALFLLGASIALLAVIGFAIVVLIQILKLLPMNSANEGAWIGFAGNVVGALITVVVAIFALWPAYGQMGEMRRASAVQSGQILRTRFKAAQAEWNILLKSIYTERLTAILTLRDKDIDRETWIRHHPQEFAELSNIIIPRLNEVEGDLFTASASTELPDLDRSTYTEAVDKLKARLYCISDGVERAQNGGAPLGTMTPTRWREYVKETLDFNATNIPQARLQYNNDINTALQLLRYQILESDKAAIGKRSFNQFQQWQKMNESPPKPKG